MTQLLIIKKSIAGKQKFVFTKTLSINILIFFNFKQLIFENSADYMYGHTFILRKMYKSI